MNNGFCWLLYKSTNCNSCEDVLASISLDYGRLAAEFDRLEYCMKVDAGDVRRNYFNVLSKKTAVVSVCFCLFVLFLFCFVFQIIVDLLLS